jgi:hypothetical protein
MGKALTESSGNMDILAVRNLLGEHITEELGQISGMMPLEQVVKLGGVVCSVCVTKRKLSHICGYTHHLQAFFAVVVFVVVAIDSLQ